MDAAQIEDPAQAGGAAAAPSTSPYFERQYDPAIKQLGRPLELDHNFPYVHFFLGWAWEQKKDFAPSTGPRKLTPRRSQPLSWRPANGSGWFGERWPNSDQKSAN